MCDITCRKRNRNLPKYYFLTRSILPVRTDVPPCCAWYHTVHIQGGALTTLVLQNSALALVMRYTRVSGMSSDLYISTTAVVMAEMFKLTVALAVQLQVSPCDG